MHHTTSIIPGPLTTTLYIKLEIKPRKSQSRQRIPRSGSFLAVLLYRSSPAVACGVDKQIISTHISGDVYGTTHCTTYCIESAWNDHTWYTKA